MSATSTWGTGSPPRRSSPLKESLLLAALVSRIVISSDVAVEADRGADVERGQNRHRCVQLGIAHGDKSCVRPTGDDWREWPERGPGELVIATKFLS
jgi:hypothetical protein